MIITPACVARNCRHFQGILEVDGDPRIEDSDIGGFICPAFPNGIPRDIVDGDNLHTIIDPRQVGVLTFEKK